MGQSQRLFEILKGYLRRRRILLILDNFEQVLTAGPLVLELVTFSPGLRIIVTSREPLHVRGEREFSVMPLKLASPDDERLAEQLIQHDAIRLFMDRAKAVRPEFKITNRNASAIADICLRVDGLPLAIELAASRLKYLPARQLLDRLTESLMELKGGARDLPPRQRTIWSTIAWSYNLLEEAEKTLLMTLSVCSGSFDIEAAKAVYTSKEISVFDGIVSLVDRNMLREEHHEGQARYRMLETIKAFGRSNAVEHGLEEGLDRKHAEHYLMVAERIEPELRKANQISWLSQLSLDHKNFIASLKWCNKQKEFKTGLSLTVALGWYWVKRGIITEGWKWYKAFLWNPSNFPRKKLRIKALFVGSFLAVIAEGYPGARKLLEECVDLARENGDRDYLACALSFLGAFERICSNYIPQDERETLRWSGWNHSYEGATLVKETANPWIKSFTLIFLYGQMPFPSNADLSDQLKQLENAIDCAKESGDIWWIALAYQYLAGPYIATDADRAIQYYTVGKEIFQKMGDT